MARRSWFDRLSSGLSRILGTIAGESEEEADEVFDPRYEEPIDSDFGAADYPIEEEPDIFGEPEYDDYGEEEISLYYIDGTVMDTMTQEQWKETLIDMDKYELAYYYGGRTHLDIIDELIALGEWDAEDWREFREAYAEAHAGASV